MNTLEIKIPVKVLDAEELSPQDRELVEAAKQATARSLATYSRFSVGAAIRMSDGSIITGANQENAAFPSSMCAERTAAYWASAQKPGMAMKKIAIAANTFRLHGTDFASSFQSAPIAPCGACRQALLEYEHLYGPMEVILYGADKIYVLPSVASLLPVTFTEF